MDYNSSVKLQNYLNTTIYVDGKPTKVIDCNIKIQTEFLVETDFEFFRSSQMKRWRLENLYYIITKNGQRELFKLNEAQSDFLENVLNKGYMKVIMLKSRQLGFTTFMSIYILDEIIFSPNKEALQLAHIQKDARDIFNRKVQFAIKNMFQGFFEMLEIKISQNRAGKAQFTYEHGNGSVSQSSFTVTSSGRGNTPSFVHVSELAKLSRMYPDRASEFTTGTIPSVPTVGSLVVIESTAEGSSGLFYDMYMDSFKNKSRIKVANTIAEFYPVFYNWQWDKKDIEEVARVGIINVSDMEDAEIDWASYQKEYNLTDKEISYYYTKYIQSGRDVNKLNQEYPTTEMDAFISSGSNYFSNKKIFDNLQKKHEYETYDFVLNDSNDLIISQTNSTWGEKFEGIIVYEKPIPGRLYAIGVDVAEGLMHGDWTVMTVLGFDKKVKAIYRGHIEPGDCAKFAAKLAEWYNKALLGVEFNKDGNWVNTELVRMGYENLYFREQVDDITQSVTRKYGWLTTGGATGTRNMSLGEFKNQFNMSQNFPYYPILEEMQFFVRDKKGKAQAASGKHDDIIMATAITFGMLANKKQIINDEKEKQGYMHLVFRE